MNEIERDKKAYSLAKEYLLGLEIAGVTSELIDKYLHFSQSLPRPGAIAEIYKHILQSAQNANMKPGVVGHAIGGVEKLGMILCEFQ